ncbi:FG-GAP repeat protein [candidate division KSB1 bacterium]|nr:FG-GAP repeat protein [candidate division KSB1 bacterium]
MKKLLFSIIALIFIQFILAIEIQGQSDIHPDLHKIDSDGNIDTTEQLPYIASFLGIRIYERIGYSLSTAGDVNNDGCDDFLIGTFHNSSRGMDAGAAYLILGNRAADWGNRVSLDKAHARFLGKKAYDAVGACVAGGGDVNGDGYDDILIGAPAGNDEVITEPGKVYILFGRANPSWGFNCVLESSANVILAGELGWDQGVLRGGLAGNYVTILKDQNGDGCDEFLVSAPYLDTKRNDAGRVYLIPGRKTDWPSRSSLLSLAVATFDPPTGYRTILGYSMDNLGDCNGDGLDDFIIGAPGVSKAYILYGRKNMDWGLAFDLEKADAIINGAESAYKLGYQVAGVGDVNGDDFPDIAASTIQYNKYAGKIFLFPGKAGGWSGTVNVAEAFAAYEGEAADDQAGWYLSGMGDYDGDRLNDFLIGMFNDSDRGKPGKAYFIRGRKTGWPGTINLKNHSDYFLGLQNGDLTGYCLSGAGDLNGDGWDDFLVASPYFSTQQKWCGQVEVFVNKRGKLALSGTVINQYNKSPMSEVILTLTGNDSITSTTDSQGKFAFQCWEKDNYQITARLASQPFEFESFITAYDALLTARHVVGLEKLSADHLTAADVDKDGQITLMDAVLILQYSVHKSPSRPSFAGEWHFIPEPFEILWLTKNIDSLSLSGVIKGNVDGKFTTGFLRSDRELSNIIAKIKVQQNEKFIIPVYINASTQAFDLKLEYDAELVEFKRFNQTAYLNGFQIETNFIEPGVLHLAGFTTTSCNEAVSIGTIQFSALLKNQHETEIIKTIQLNDAPVKLEKIQIEIENSDVVPASFQVKQNFPNPFNLSTRIYFDIDAPGKLEIKIFNLQGQEIQTLISESYQSGHHFVDWNATDHFKNIVNSGIYIYRLYFQYHDLQKGNIEQTKKMLLIK